MNQVEDFDGSSILSWNDIELIDIGYSQGLMKVLTYDDIEIKIDVSNTEILQVAQPRSDLIESIHDGSWFAEFAKLWLFFPSRLIFLLLWVTGRVLFILPFYLRAKNKINRKSQR